MVKLADEIIVAKLLVSDDDPQILELVSLVLEGAGHSVVTTSDPRAVCRMATGTDIDAIILDVNMPISGFEVLNELRSNEATESLPILFLSGLGASADRVRGLREGADDYLVKPFEPAELVLRVERLVSWGERSGPVAKREPGGQKRPANKRKLVRERGKDPKHLGRYEVLGVLGQGSMGTVYRGRDPRLERPVALKTIRLEAAGDSQHRLELLDRLRREAVTIARFNQPNIIAVYDMGNAGDTAFIAMEFVEGLSLRDYLRTRGPMEPERMIPMASCVARGLAVAHAGEVIHRDVKPGNVLLGRDGAIKVSDFGLAFVVSAMTEDSTEISGTPGFVPPEVMNNVPYTEAGDVFGLGATLYQSLTGVHPLAGASLRETIMNTMRGAFKPLTHYLPDLDPELIDLVNRLLSPDPEARPTAEQVTDLLESFATEHDYRWSPEFLAD